MLQFLHSELGGRLDSESASELLAKGRLAALLAPGESSLFSASIREFLVPSPGTPGEGEGEGDLEWVGQTFLSVFPWG